MASRTVRFSKVAILIAALAIAGRAQETSQETSSVAGVVTDAATGRPLAGATVSGPAKLPEFPPNGILAFEVVEAALARRPQATTDAKGTFVLERLGSGTVQLNVTKPGYMGHPIRYTLSPGQRLSGASLFLSPLGKVSGRVFDGSGKPAVNTNVLAYLEDSSSGRKELVLANSTRSDDRGEYRLINLPPDRYLIQFCKVQTRVEDAFL